MYFKPMFRGVNYNHTVDEGSLIYRIVNEATDPDRSGAVEDLEAKLEELTRVVGQMFAHLPAQAQADIARHFCWEPNDRLNKGR